MIHTIRFGVLLVAAALTVPTFAADPLPKGAKVRLGTPLLRDSGGWAGTVLSSDGKHLIAQRPQGLTKFDVTTGEPAGTIGEKGGAANRIELSSDGSRALSVNYSSVTVWDTGSGKTLAEVKRPIPYGDSFGSLSADGKVFALGGSLDVTAKDKPVTALVWDVEKKAKLTEVAVLQNQSANVSLSPDGKLLATWGQHFEKNPPKEGVDPATDPNRIVQLWDAASGKELAKVRIEGYGTRRVVFSPDGQTAALSLGSGSIRLIDPKTGAERRRLFGRSDQGARLAFSPDGKTLASAGTDAAIQLWNVADGTRIALVECPVGTLSSGVRGIAFTSPDRAVAWTNVGITALVWEVPSGKLLSPFAGHVAAVRSIAFGNEGKEILTSGDDGLILKWDAAGKQLGDVKLCGSGSYGHTTRFPMNQVFLTADGKHASSLSLMSGVFEMSTGRQIASPQAGVNFESRAMLCGDARTLLIIPNVPYPPKPQPKSLKIPVWDVATGAKLCELEAPVGEFIVAAVSPDRSKLATTITTRGADNKNELHVIGWELATGKKLGTLTEPGGYGTTYLTMAPDNVSALATTPAGKLLIVNLMEGKASKEIDTNRRNLSAAPVFAPGGKQFAMANTNGFGASTVAEIKLVDWESGKPVGSFQGHAGSVMCLAFSPDGKTLATGGTDSTVLLWDVSAGTPSGE